MKSRPTMISSMLLALMLLLAACGGSPDSEDAGQDSTEADTSLDSTSATGAGDAATDGDSPRSIVVLMPPGTDTYLAEWQRGAQEQGEALGWDVTIVENDFDQAEQDLQVQQALSADALPDMFMWWPVDNAAGVASLSDLHDSGVPVMQVNQFPVPEADGFWDMYAGVDDVFNGEVSGELLVEARDLMVENGQNLHSEGGNALVIMFPAGYSAADDRLDGLLSATGGSGIEVIDEVNVGFDETSGYEAGLSLIPANRDTGIDLVYAENDALASGVILALEESGYSPGEDVMVVGGTCHGNLSDLEEGQQYATGLQAARLEGMHAILTAENYFATGEVEEGEHYPDPDPDAIPDLPSPPRTNNFIPNPAVYGADIADTSLWGFSMTDLCTY